MRFLIFLAGLTILLAGCSGERPAPSPSPLLSPPDHIVMVPAVQAGAVSTASWLM